MCDPATAFMAIQGVSAVTNAMGASTAASGEKNNYKINAALEDTNAKISEMNAQRALAAGQFEEQSSRLTTAQLKAAQKTGFAANGIALDGDPTSTVNNVLTSTDYMGEVDAKNIQLNTISQAFGYRIEAANHKNAALIGNANAAAVNPRKAAATSLLGSTSSIGSSFFQLKGAGAFS